MAGVEAIGRQADTSWSLFNQSGGVKSNKKETINPPQSGGSTGSSFNFQDINNAIGSMGGGGMAGDAISGLATSIWGNKNGSFSEDEQATQSAIRKGLEMIPGYGQAIAAATGLVDAIGTATGLNLASIDHDTAKRTGVTGTGFNKVMNMLPGNSMIWGGLSAAFGNERTQSLNISDEVLGMSDGFSGSVRDLEAAKDLGNKRLFFWQTRQANDYIDAQKDKLHVLNNIQSVNTQRKQSDYYQDLQNQNINRYAGQNYLGTHVGKNGMKLMSLEEARRIVAMKKAAETEEVEKFQNGGNIPGIDTNILPEGALHKERHHLEEINPDLKDATKKGIPVVEGIDNQEVAEIERTEIILRLEVTEQLEALMKDGSDEAMIKAGKLIADEIVLNTTDPDNIIDETE